MGNTNKHLQEEALKNGHPNFNDAKIVTDQNRKFIEAKFKVQNKEYEEWNKRVMQGNQINPEYLMLPEKANFKDDAGLCGNTGTLTNQYANYPYLLSELIKDRQKERRLFKESELWYVLYALTAAKRDIRVKSDKVGDIKPENIFVNAEGQIKVANVFSWPHELPSYQKAIEQPDFNGLLAPEDLNGLQINHLDNEVNEQSEIFAIGATVLCTGILEDFTPVYNYKEKAYNMQALMDKKRTWGETDKYSQIFKSIILNLVATSPQQRLTLDQLWAFVAPFESSILEKKQFVIPSAPPKVEQSFAALQSKVY